MNIKELYTDLKGICKAYNLGRLKDWKTEKYRVEGYTVATFSTEKESARNYIFKTNTQ